MHNEQQLQAINSNARTIMVVAGPGSGKTATTVARIMRLITDGTDPRGIVALTFTNNAARELEERLRTFEDAGTGDVLETTKPLGYGGTLHGFALRMLKQHGTALGYGPRMAIIDPEASSDLLQSKADQLGCKLKLADLEKLKGAGRPDPTTRPTLPQSVVAAYYDELREAGLVDFDIMLAEFLRLLTPGSLTVAHPAFPAYTHLFVDEAQDSSSLDWKIYQALPIEQKFYVGDPDQAIYSFRGGKVQEFINRATQADLDDDKQLIYLETNYRSHAEICSAANNLIAHNRTRLEKHTISAKGKGGYVDILGRIPNMAKAENEGEELGQVVRQIKTMIEGDDLNEPDLTKPTIAVLTRTNDIAYAYRTALKAAGIPVKEAPRPELPKDWATARALIAWLVQPENDTLAYAYQIQSKLAHGATPAEARKEAHAIRRQANAEGRTINAALFNWRPEPITAVAEMLAAVGFSLETKMMVAGKIKELGPEADMLALSLSLADTRTGLPAADKPTAAAQTPVNVSTIHGAKGLEFDIVYVVGVEQEIIPGVKKNAPPDMVEEERRLFYVAITRARRSLYIRWCAQRKTPWGAIENHKPSQFIDEVLS